jgi:hypothetical protein
VAGASQSEWYGMIDLLVSLLSDADPEMRANSSLSGAAMSFRRARGL